MGAEMVAPDRESRPASFGSGVGTRDALQIGLASLVAGGVAVVVGGAAPVALLGVGLGGVVATALAWRRREDLVAAHDAEIEVLEAALAVGASEREELSRRQIDAERANRSKSAFLTQVSHGLRTPLTTVLGMLETTLPEVEGRPRSALEAALQAGRSLGSLVDDLVDLAQLEAGQVTLQRRTFDLRLAAEAVVMASRPLARRLGIQLVLDLDEEAMVYGDEVRCRQVLGCLLSHALEQGPGEVRVELSWASAESVRFSVLDAGPPTQARDLLDLTDPGGGRNTGAGVAVGLTVARALCQYMGGRDGVQSDGGRNSIWLELPLEHAGTPPIPRFGHRVSIALDDGHAFRGMLSRQLAVLDCAVVEPGAGPVLVFAPTPRSDEVEVRSANGGGLERLSLPCRRDELVAVLRRCGEPMGMGRRGRHEEEVRLRLPAPVLVVEDNEINRIVARRMLEGIGCVVHTAHDGYEALERLEAGGSYALVFMDIQMPGIDGYETARRIRAREDTAGRRMPIVALTANALPEHRAASLEAGMDDHVTKPIKREMLVAALTRWAGAMPVTLSEFSSVY